MFSCEFCGISKNPFFKEHLGATASVFRNFSYISTEVYWKPCQTFYQGLFAKNSWRFHIVEYCRNKAPSYILLRFLNTRFIHNTEKWLNILSIFWKIIKVCLATFQHYEWKGCISTSRSSFILLKYSILNILCNSSIIWEK